MFNFFRRDKQVTINPSIVTFTTFFLLLLYFVWSVRSILTLFFLGFILMTALSPLAHGLQNKLRFPRAIAIAIVYVFVFLLIGITVALVVPPLASQIYELVRNFNIPGWQNEFRNFSFNLSEIDTLVKQINGSFNAIYSVISTAFGGVFTFLTVIVISLYLMLDRNNLHKRVSWFTNKRTHIKKAEDFVDSLEHQLGGWIRGQLILMITIGVVTYVGLSLLGVPYAGPLALLAGSLEILPNLGPTIAAIPSVILAYVVLGPVMGLFIVIFYLLVQQLENNFLVPKIMKDNVDVSPLVSIMSILIGFKLGGVIGALLAIPIYIVARTLYSTWFREQLLS